MPDVTSADLQALQRAFQAFEQAYGEMSAQIKGSTQKTFIQEKNKEVERAFAKLRTALGDLPAAGAAPGEVETVEIRESKAPPRHDTTSIAAFFESVGQGVVEAQRNLDQRSLDYMAQASGFPPTAFRLPKVSAEIQFGIESVSSEGFDIFVARREDTTRESMQHRVSFDIVSTPLPPEVLASLAANSVTLPFLGNPMERAAVRARLLAFAEAGEGSPTSLQGARDLAEPARFRQALIFALERCWFFLLPSLEEEKPRYEMAYLERDGSGFTLNSVTLPKGQSPVVAALMELAAGQMPLGVGGET